MIKEKKWQTKNKVNVPTFDESSGKMSEKLKVDNIVDLLLENRNIKTSEEKERFLHPKLEDVTPEFAGLDKTQLKKAVKRIKKAVDEKEQIVIFGDYDVDGITGTAILWESLFGFTKAVVPYIPHRVDEGYGLSTKGISNVKLQISNVSLIITVDNGIVAHEAVRYAKKEGIDVIVTDHHTVGKKLPDAYAVVHTTKLCGAGVAWLLSQEILNSNIEIKNNTKIKNSKIENNPVILSDSEGSQGYGVHETRDSSVKPQNDKLELVCLGTIADLVPLTGANRTLVTFGLEALRKTSRPGLQALFQEAQLTPEKIGVYEVGHIIAPRLNAMGRLESAMDSLRLLCTKDRSRAVQLSEKLGMTNRERQIMTVRMTEHAIERIKNQEVRIKSILFVYDEMYEQGIIGLIAGRLVERFYRPAIVVSKGEKISKASARSITGFNIIEFLRLHSHLLLEHGGHPMAAGFSVETEKLLVLQENLEKLAGEQITGEMLTRVLKIDCEVPVEWIDQKLYDALQSLAPFGMANPEPIFVSRSVLVREIRAIGMEGKHLKMKVGSAIMFDAIGFGMGELVNEIKLGDMIDIAYTVDENTWNGRTSLQLKVKDIKKAT